MTQSTDSREQALSYIRHQASKSLGDLVALIERTAADCDRCLEDVSEEQAAFRYDEEWCIKEVLGHMLVSGKGVNHEIANLVEDSPSAREARMGIVSGADRPVGELRQTLTDLWAETGRLVGSLPEDGNLERTWDHPMFGSLNFREWIAFQRLHAMDHVQQMEKVKAHSDYPKA
ncbi:MAG: DinB family protein [Chloroflexi bacterium]|nr:DinB family protein [Chloroflexota bacterium]